MNTRSPIITDAVHAAKHDGHLIFQALVNDLMAPGDLDAQCQAHVQGFTGALKQHPTLPIPPGFLEQISEYNLWPLLKTPAAAAELASRLLAEGCTLDPYSITRGLLLPGKPIPEIVEESILTLARDGRLTSHNSDAMRDHGWLSEEGVATLIRLNRSASARRAAATRKHTQAATPAPRVTQKQDPLLLALRSKDADKLRRFDLEHLAAKRFAAVLPTWLASPTPMQAHLVRVPGLPPDIMDQAMTAWAENRFNPHARLPIPPDLLSRLTWQAAATALISYTRDHIAIEPPLTEQHVTDALFRIALEDPELATSIKENLILLAWHQGLPPTDSRTPAPNDEETRWIGLMAQRHNPSITRPFTLALHKTYQAWPPKRQRALADTIGALITVSLNLPNQRY